MSLSDGQWSGLIYLLMGIILVGFDGSMLKRDGPESYTGSRLISWAWFIFGVALIIIGIYVFSKN